MMKINVMTDLTIDGDLAVLTIDNPPVNALSAEVRDGIYEGLGRAIADPAVKAVVLMCAGRTFVAGGDISALGTKQSGAPTRQIARRMEDSPKPVVAAIHGSALGGGFETALAAHWRIAARDARVGLPEVKLGILPGAGGTQRLPRLVGPEKALDMIVFGEPISAAEALQAGAVDALVEGDDLRAEAVAFARSVAGRPDALKRARDAEHVVQAGQANFALFDDFAARHADSFRGALAPAACLKSIRAAFELPFEAGLDKERAITETLIPSLQSRALRHVFFAERDIFKIPGVGRDASLVPIRKVAVLAATPDGVADARAFAAAGLQVVLYDPRGAAETPTGVAGTRDHSALHECDLVLDPTFEPLDAQRSRLKEAAPHLRSDAIVATMALAEAGDLVAPDRLIGVHFFYPGDQRRFVEIVRTDATSAYTAASVSQLFKRMGKLAMLVKHDPVGVASRAMGIKQASAEAAVLEGAASPAAIDAALYDFGFPEGVFAWEDRVGLDVGWLRTGGAGDELRTRLCALGRTGRKAGRGFYDYAADGSSAPAAEVEALVAASPTVAREAAPLADAALVRRLMAPIVNEGAKLLEAGLVIRAADIDLMWVSAFGWPAWRGGPMFFGEHELGLAAVVEELGRLQARFGDAYRPSPVLERLARQGEGFASI